MRKVAVLSTNDFTDYLFYLPVVTEGWFKLGYDVCLFYLGEADDKRLTLALEYVEDLQKDYNRRFTIHFIKSVEGVDDITLIQCSRLFAACFDTSDKTRFITGDIDMLVKKDIFQDNGTIDVYGHDLTNFGHIPICYISMTADRWAEVMGIDPQTSFYENAQRIITADPSHNSTLNHVKWATDQEIITKLLKPYFYYNHERGTEQGSFLPKGRLDRYNWKYPEEIIDVHLPRNPLTRFGDIITLCGGWFPEYFNRFKSITE